MRLIADLHVHSLYSRATSRDIHPETLHLWAQRKGIHLLGTGDFTHPRWYQELVEKLQPAEDGLWELKPLVSQEVDRLLPPSCRGPVRFVFQTEISTIYKKAGRTRKVHHLILLPGVDAVQRLMNRLGRIGNLSSDGRPILGLDSRDLIETVLESSQEAVFIPAHVWTPWFSVFGSRSGFDELEECYGDLSHHIPALETGLSSDPSMNWRWSRLDGFRLVSNSDAHSPQKLGREANILEIPLSFSALRRALFTGEGLQGTLEFFPEQGKYHVDGHRKCGVRMEPPETRRHHGRCPACGRPVTVGVMHRVNELSDRPPGAKPANGKPFLRLLSLEGLLGEVLGAGPAAKRVQSLYHQLLERWGPEISILADLPLSVVEEARIPMLAEVLRRMREGRILVEAGFDGQYGTIRLLRDEERASLMGQGMLLTDLAHPPPQSRPAAQPESFVGPTDSPWTAPPKGPHPPVPAVRVDPLSLLNPGQREAVLHGEGPLMILAGPGTGKTLTLTHRIARLIREGHARPQEALAVTFTQRAAREMQERLKGLLDGQSWADEIQVLTLHAFGLRFLRSQWTELGWKGQPLVLDESARMGLFLEAMREECPGIGARSLPSLMERVARWRQLSAGETSSDSLVAQAARAYERKLRQKGVLDYEDLLILPLGLLEEREEFRQEVHRVIRLVFVDEFQDLNPLQLRLLKLLSPPGAHLTVIGDPDQSIYGFRGAKPCHFLRFQEEFHGAHMIRLEENYRSTGILLEAALGLIRQNPLPFPRSLAPRRHRGTPIQYHVLPSEKAEAVFVAQEIDRLLGGTSHWAMRRGQETAAGEGGNLAFGDVAILYRVHALASSLEETLSKEGIPYQRFGERAWRGRQDLEGLFSALRWTVDPDRDEDLLTALSTPSLGLGEATEASMRALPHAASSPLWEQVSQPAFLETLAPVEATRFRRLAASLQNLIREFESAPVPLILARAMATLRIPLPKPSSRWDPGAEALKGLIAAAQGWQRDLVSFLDLWSLQEEADLYDPRAERVALLTVHAAKGLEFPVVFLVGCEEGLFPLKSEQGDLEEERRLFYVAMTRARDVLYVTRAKSRTLLGQRLERAPSPFLLEIPRELTESHGESAEAHRPKPSRQLKLF